jgi:hypothetical protein
MISIDDSPFRPSCFPQLLLFFLEIRLLEEKGNKQQFNKYDFLWQWHLRSQRREPNNYYRT